MDVLFYDLKSIFKKSVFDSWAAKQDEISRRVKTIDKILDIYDGFCPLTRDEIELQIKDVQHSSKVLEIMKFGTSYETMDAYGVDGTFESALPGWLKKVILRFYSKFTLKDELAN